MKKLKIYRVQLYDEHGLPNLVRLASSKDPSLIMEEKRDAEGNLTESRLVWAASSP